MQRMLVALVLLGSLATAHAGDGVNGFVVEGKRELRGHVTDERGAPLGRAQVHVVSANGSVQLALTDRDGAYRVVPEGDFSLVYVDGAARIAGQTREQGTGDVIEIHEQLPPAVPARSLAKQDLILDYSDAAIDRDAWARAWLLLAIDARGEVTAVKLLDDPGADLGPIAVRGALALRFEPARDRAGRAVRSMLLWSFEWPPYWWMIENHLSLNRLPPKVRQLPCLDTYTPDERHRDCSRPTLAAVLTQAWISGGPKPEARGR